MRDVADFANNVWWPNITGGVGAKGGVAWQEGFGCLEVAGALAEVVASIPNETSARSLYLSASKSSSIYSGSKMQAPALQVLACIRT